LSTDIFPGNDPISKADNLPFIPEDMFLDGPSIDDLNN
jgi:hypothetical protein